MGISFVLLAACTSGGGSGNGGARRDGGGGDEPGDDGGKMHGGNNDVVRYGCDVPGSGSGAHRCTEYALTGANLSTESYESECDAADGTSVTSCPLANAVGTCTVVTSIGGSSVQTVSWFYSGTASSLASACAAVSGAWQAGGGGGGGNQTPDPDKDVDADGYTPNEGDCDDGNALINPGASEIAGNFTDDDCDGNVDETALPCEGTAVGQTTAGALVAGMGLCDDAIVVAAVMSGPSDVRARAVVPSFGVITPKSGNALTVLSTGVAAAANNGGFMSPQSGVTLGASNTAPHPAPSLPTLTGCGQANPATVNDYTELKVTLKVPSNANTFAFDFVFLSAEYPEFVCTSFNDNFVALLDDGVNLERNIAYDTGGLPISVNNGLFRVCENDNSKPQTQNCTQPISAIAGTGFDTKAGSWDTQPIGGATGWLHTTVPVTPGSTIQLRFIIWDAGDHIYDSTVLLDNFTWSVESADGPTTSG